MPQEARSELHPSRSCGSLDAWRSSQNLIHRHCPRSRHILRGDLDSRSYYFAELGLFLGREEYVPHLLLPPGPVVQAADVDRSNAFNSAEQGVHCRDVAREDDAAARIVREIGRA